MISEPVHSSVPRMSSAGMMPMAYTAYPAATRPKPNKAVSRSGQFCTNLVAYASQVTTTTAFTTMTALYHHRLSLACTIASGSAAVYWT